MRLANLLAPACQECQAPSWKLFCHSCQEKMKIGEQSSVAVNWEKIVLEFNYTKAAENWLHDIKMNRRPERWRELKDLQLTQFPNRFQVLSVSSDPLQMKKRLFDSSESFGQSLAEHLNLPYLGVGFNRGPYLSPQKRLRREEREISLAPLLSLKPEFQRPLGSVLLVDDVMTTGATIKTHAQLLRPFCKEIWIYCLFHVSRRLE